MALSVCSELPSRWRMSVCIYESVSVAGSCLTSPMVNLTALHHTACVYFTLLLPFSHFINLWTFCVWILTDVGRVFCTVTCNIQLWTERSVIFYFFTQRNWLVMETRQIFYQLIWWLYLQSRLFKGAFHLTWQNEFTHHSQWRRKKYHTVALWELQDQVFLFKHTRK